MSLTVSAALIVSAEPVALDEDRSPPTAVFPVADHDATTATAGQPTGSTTAFEIGEVICRGNLAVSVLQQLKTGQRILVTGDLTPRPASGPTLDVAAVMIAIEATHIGNLIHPAT